MEDKRLREEFDCWIKNTNKTILELKETVEFDYSKIKELQEEIEELRDELLKDRIKSAIRDRSIFM